MSPLRRAATALAALAVVGGAAGALLGAGSTPAPATTSAAPASTSRASSAPTSGAPAPAADAAAAPREGFARSLAIAPGSRAGAAPATASGAATSAAALAPVSVSVPRIGLDTPLLDLGIAADGSLEVPGRDQSALAGWLTTSAVPGEAGASVIAGHVDSTSGPAVFFRLHELVPGDEVRVGRADGSTAVFTVDEVRRVGKDSFPTADVYGPQPGPVLRLITCGGRFDRSTGHYEDNVIAFASAA